jgi:RNA recognition motif-containing protein
MPKKLFVGSLGWNTKDEALREAFARFGEVTEAKVITDRETGRSRGFGFVTFANPEDADAVADAATSAETATAGSSLVRLAASL